MSNFNWLEESKVNCYGSIAQQCGNKRKFGTRRRAKDRAHELRKETGIPFRAYQCPICERWHLARRRHEEREPRFTEGGSNVE